MTNRLCFTLSLLSVSFFTATCNLLSAKAAAAQTAQTAQSAAAAKSAESQSLPASPPSPPAPLPKIPSEVIPLYLSNDRMLVMLRIENNPPVPVVFDTGTNGNLLDLDLAKRWKLPKKGPSPSIDGSTGKPVPGFDTFIKGATIGGVAIPDARATAFAYNLPDEVGIFGPNSFPGKLVRMDGSKGRLTLLPKQADTIPPGAPFAYLGNAGDALPSALVECGDVTFTAILDSGNNSSILLPMEYATKLALDAPPVKIGEATSAAGTQPVYSAHLKGQMKIGDAVLEQPEIRFMAGGRPNVGLPILRKLIVVMDPSEKRNWVLPAGAPIRQNAATTPATASATPK